MRRPKPDELAREQEILRMTKTMPDTEVAKHYNVTPARIGQLKRRAMKRLAQTLQFTSSEAFHVEHLQK